MSAALRADRRKAGTSVKRFATLLLLLMGTALAATPDNVHPVSGTVGAACEPPWIFVLRLTNLPNRTGEAYLRYHEAGYNPDAWTPPLHKPLRFSGKVYVNDDQHLNDPYRDATITFETFTGKEASGTYIVTLRDGTQQNGNFLVKRYRLSKKRVNVCL
jgi:hypothetical protein